MRKALSVRLVDRRDFVLAAGAATLITTLLGAVPHADATEHSADFEASLAAVLKGATPKAGGVEMDLPTTVENGDYVPVALSVASPMTPENNVRALYLLSTANPRAHVATFHFTPLSGKAHVTSRMRLAKTQDVVAIAELGDGTFLMSTRLVDVKVGGCGI